MKSYCLIFTIFLIITCNQVSAEIKNGYEKEIKSVRRSLNGLCDILHHNSNLPLSQKRQIKDKIKTLIEFVSYYEITENLLNQFRILSPELFHEINTIRDSKGKITDVFVKFIPNKQGGVQAAGTTCLAQVADDIHTYASEYGDGTVSVKIWLVSNALWVLSHEFGHVKYQVPNLASYIKFHKDNYQGKLSDPNNVGHNANDPSGKSAIAFVKRFGENYSMLLRSGHKLESPLLLIGDIRKKVETETLSVNLSNL